MTRQALFTQAGITATRSVGELLETAALLHSQPLPAGHPGGDRHQRGRRGRPGRGRLRGGGAAAPAAHAPSWSTSLLAVLPDGATAGNPVDATAAVTEEQLRDCVDRLMRHPGIDAVLVALVPTAVAAATGDDLVRALTRGPARRARPVAVVRLEQALPVELLPAADGGPIPSYAEPRRGGTRAGPRRSRARPG